MKATILVDNISSEKAKGEWGLCIYIEYKDKKVLLDTGASNLFLKNASVYGIDISDIDYAVLSHAHYDHANGMEGFFGENAKAKFYLQKSCCNPCYFKKLFFRHHIGIPKTVIPKFDNRICLVEQDTQISDGIWLIPHKTKGLEAIGKQESMYVKTQNGLIPDDFSHEQSLVFEVEDELVVFNSCSHGGAATIIKEVQESFPERKVKALIGGFHIFKKSRKEVLELARKIQDTGIEVIYTGHCTGEKSFHVLEEVLGEQAKQLKVGLTMEF